MLTFFKIFIFTGVKKADIGLFYKRNS